MQPDDAPSALPTPAPPTRPWHPPGIKRWQSLTGFAGLLLASTCFLPIAYKGNSPLVPFSLFSEYLAGHHPSSSSTVDAFSELIIVFCAFLLAYSFGALEAVSAVLRCWGVHRWASRTSQTTTTYLWILTAALAVNAILATVKKTFRNELILLGISLAVPLLGAIHMWRSRQQGSGRWICLSFMGSVFCFLWFGFLFFAFFIARRLGAYGLCLSWIASGFLLGAVIGEARCVARTSWLKTVWLLIISRLPDGRHKGHCPQCDYILFGLPEPRCPECGRPFTPDEAGLAPLPPSDIAT